MRERQGQGHQNKKLDSSGSRFTWNGLSAIIWKNKLDSAIDFYNNDWRTGSSGIYITDKEFTNRIAIIFISAGTFGAGIGQLLAELVNR